MKNVYLYIYTRQRFYSFVLLLLIIFYFVVAIVYRAQRSWLPVYYGSTFRIIIIVIFIVVRKLPTDTGKAAYKHYVLYTHEDNDSVIFHMTVADLRRGKGA